MAAGHAEEDLTTVVGDRLEEDRTVVVDCAGIAAGVVGARTAGVAVGRPEERSWGDSSEEPTVEAEAVVADHVEDHFEVGRAEGHAAEGDGYSATEELEDLDNHLADLPEEGLAEQELGGLCMAQGCVGRSLEDLAVAALVGDLGHCSRLHVGKVKVDENHHVRLGCLLCHLEEHHRRVEAAARIRTEVVAAADRSLMEGAQVVEEGVEGSCIDLATCLLVNWELPGDSTRQQRTDESVVGANEWKCVDIGETSVLMSKLCQLVTLNAR